MRRALLGTLFKGWTLTIQTTLHRGLPLQQRRPPSHNASVTDRILAFMREPSAGITVNWLQFPLSVHLDMNFMSRLRAYSVAEGQTTRYVATTTAGLELLVRFNRDSTMSFSTVVGAGGNVNLDTNAALHFNNEVMAYVSFDP